VRTASPARSAWSRTSRQRPARPKTAGTRSPWESACSQPTSPPGAAAARRCAPPRARCPGRPPRTTARSAGRARAPPGRRSRTPPPGCTAGWRGPRPPSRRGRRRRRGVAGPQVDAGAGQVAPRVRERLLGELHRVHPRPRRLVGDRLGDGARPGAQVDEHRLLDAGRTRSASLLDPPAGEQLGLRARREDARARPRARRSGTRRCRAGAAAAHGPPARAPAHEACAAPGHRCQAQPARRDRDVASSHSASARATAARRCQPSTRRPAARGSHPRVRPRPR
jgi:hypothetical protein